MKRHGGDVTVLDDPVRAALSERHAAFAQRCGRAWRYQPDVSPFSRAGRRQGNELQHLGDVGCRESNRARVRPGWLAIRDHLNGVEVPTQPPAVRDQPRRPDERPDALSVRTIELGTYRGFRDQDELVAMAGERFSSRGWIEISAICTTPGHRGRGLASRLTATLAAGIAARGDRPYLHVRADNMLAIGVYERLGFSVRREMAIYRVSPPLGSPERE